MTVPIHAMGEHWHPEGFQRTPLGALVARAKDDREPEAISELAELFGQWATTLVLPHDLVVTAVAPSPERDDRLAEAMAAAVAVAVDRPLALYLVERRHATSRLRDADPSERPALTQAAGYSVDPAARGRSVVLVDDVVLTGTTINHVAALLGEEGALEVVGLVATRTRRDTAPD